MRLPAVLSALLNSVFLHGEQNMSDSVEKKKLFDKKKLLFGKNKFAFV